MLVFKKIVFFSFLIIVITMFFIITKSLGELRNVANSFTQVKQSKTQNNNTKLVKPEKANSTNKKYQVFQEGKLSKEFESFDDAYEYAASLESSFIKDAESSKWLWDNYPPYNVFVNNSDRYLEYSSLVDAINYARSHNNAYIYYRKSYSLIWTNTTVLNKKVLIEEVPLIQQNPELPRGCEVTSLAMLLNYKGIQVDKMELADGIKKDPTPYEVKRGQIYFGNPNYGFVGDMKNKNNNGFGVYHVPIKELMEQYLPDETLDLTGIEFIDLLYYINVKTPVWIITNSTYAPLSDKDFETWITPSGTIDITYKEHSVLITGYDENYIYFNDPLSNTPNKKSDRVNFIKAWEQMGKQAITYCP